MSMARQRKRSEDVISTIGAQQVNYITAGDGPPVIMVHGIAASLCDWTRLIPDVSQAGYRAYALDLLGHGESAKPANPRAYHIEYLYEHLAGWIEHLELPEPAYLIGHSLGGYLSLLYALRQPTKVGGLVLINPLYSKKQLSPLVRLVRRRPGIGARTIRYVPEWLINLLLGWDPISTSQFSSESRRQIANDYKRASPNFVYITRQMKDLTRQLPALDSPAMVIWGDQDMTLRPSSFARLVRMLPRATGISIPRCGHQPHIGNPEIINPIILDYLRSLAGEPIARAAN